MESHSIPGTHLCPTRKMDIELSPDRSQGPPAVTDADVITKNTSVSVDPHEAPRDKKKVHKLSDIKSGSTSPESVMFSSSVLTQGRTHHSVTGVPYCESCKSYLEKVMKPRYHELKGILGKKTSGIFQFRQSRWFLLADDHLIYYVEEADLGHTFPKGVIHLDGCVVEDPVPSSLDFYVRRKKNKFNLKASSLTEKKQWLQAIKQHDPTHAHGKQTGNVPVYTNQWFCDSCEDYVNLDSFTLSDMDGSVMIENGRIWERKWLAFAERHLAIFPDQNAISRFQPENLVHFSVQEVRVQKDYDKRKSVLTIKLPSEKILAFEPLVTEESPYDVDAWHTALTESQA